MAIVSLPTRSGQSTAQPNNPQLPVVIRYNPEAHHSVSNRLLFGLCTLRLHFAIGDGENPVDPQDYDRINKAVSTTIKRTSFVSVCPERSELPNQSGTITVKCFGRADLFVKRMMAEIKKYGYTSVRVELI